MVLPPCRYPSASWRSRVLPACRSAGHSNCRARAFRTPLPGGGSGAQPPSFRRFSPRPLDKAPRTMARCRQSDGERVGRERRLLYGLYDGSDGGDCGDGNGKDDTHDRVHEDDEGTTHANQFAALPHQFAAHSNKKPRTQERYRARASASPLHNRPFSGVGKTHLARQKVPHPRSRTGFAPVRRFFLNEKAVKTSTKRLQRSRNLRCKVCRPFSKGPQTFCRAAAKKTTLAAG